MSDVLRNKCHITYDEHNKPRVWRNTRGEIYEYDRRLSKDEMIDVVQVCCNCCVEQGDCLKAIAENGRAQWAMPHMSKTKVSPAIFVNTLIAEISKVSALALTFTTGSIDQRIAFEELVDIATTLADPSKLEEIRKTTTNTILYECADIDWDR